MKSENAVGYHINLYILSIFSQTLKKCLIIISPKHSITTTIEDSVIDIIFVGKLEVHTIVTYHCATYSVYPGLLLTIVTYHCATYSVYPGLLLIVLYLALTAKTLRTPDLLSANYSV